MSIARVPKRCKPRFAGQKELGSIEGEKLQRNPHTLGMNPVTKSTWVVSECQEMPTTAVLYMHFELIMEETPGWLKGRDLALLLRIGLAHAGRGQLNLVFFLAEASLEI